MTRTAAALLIIASALPVHANDMLPMFFEEAFTQWVASSTRLDICTSASKTDKEVKAVLDEAGDKFFPGWLEWSARSKFRDDMAFKATLAAGRGYVDARDKGCFQVRLLENIARQTLEEVLEADLLF